MSKWAYKTSKKYKEIENFVNTFKPNLDGIQGGLSHGTDFHVWVREGDNNPQKIYLKAWEPWNKNTSHQLETVLSIGNIKMLSFNMENPPRIWYFSHFPDYSQRVAVPDPKTINDGLGDTGDTLLNIFGKPGELTDDCSAVKNPLLKKYLVATSIGDHNVVGLKPAIESLSRIFSKVRNENPELYVQLNVCQSQCCRKSKGGNKKAFSIHSFGAALDLFYGNKGVVKQGAKETHLGILALYPYFHDEKWYWGAEFGKTDAMHFEISRQLVAQWQAAGELSPTP